MLSEDFFSVYFQKWVDIPIRQDCCKNNFCTHVFFHSSEMGILVRRPVVQKAHAYTLGIGPEFTFTKTKRTTLYRMWLEEHWHDHTCSWVCCTASGIITSLLDPSQHRVNHYLQMVKVIIKKKVISGVSLLAQTHPNFWSHTNNLIPIISVVWGWNKLICISTLVDPICTHSTMSVIVLGTLYIEKLNLIMAL